MLRVGIVGAGYIAESHARGYAALAPARAKLTAVTSRSYDRAADLARRFSAQPAGDFESLLEMVDVVSICSPTPSHGAYAIAALRAGKHVLCEKPIARTSAEGERIVQAARESRSTFMAAHVSRYEPEHRKAKEVLDRGEIGALRMAFHSITAPPPDWATDDWFADPAQSGGPLVDLAIHSFDYLLWLFGSPVRRVYTAGQGHGANLYALVSLRFENGGIGQVETSWAHPRPGPPMLRVELVGERGRVSWDYDGIASMQVVREGAGKTALLMVGEDSFPAQAEDFIRSIETGAAPPITADDGLAALRVSLAALESFETGRAVELKQ